MGLLQMIANSLMTGALMLYVTDYYENAVNVPKSLFTGLGLVLFGLPVIFGAAAIVIMLFYPLKKQERAIMYEELQKQSGL